MISATCNVLFSDSAAQPAKDTEDSTAGQTAGDSDCYKLAFYNIGSNVPATPAIDALSLEISEICEMVHNKDKRIIDGLTSEICDMVHDKCVDAVGISEIAQMTQTDDDEVSYSTETTDLESALVPEVCNTGIAGVVSGEDILHLSFDSSDTEPEIPDQDSAAEAFAEEVLKAHERGAFAEEVLTNVIALQAQSKKTAKRRNGQYSEKQKLRTKQWRNGTTRLYISTGSKNRNPWFQEQKPKEGMQQKPKEPAAGPNKNLGFWAFVGNNLFDEADCSSAVRPASQLELETFESQKRGFAHAHRKTCAIPNSCEQFSTVSSSKPAPQHQLSLTTKEPCAGVTSSSPTRASCFIHG